MACSRAGENESQLSAFWSRDEILNGLASEMPEKGCCMTSVVYEGKLVVFGGGTVRQYYNGVYTYDARSRVWQRPRILNATVVPPTVNHTSVLHKGSMIVFGGLTTYGCTNKTFRLDLIAVPWTWTPVNATGTVPSSRKSHASVVWKNRMYVFMGCDINDVGFNDVHYLDLTSMAWHCVYNAKPLGKLPDEGDESVVSTWESIGSPQDDDLSTPVSNGAPANTPEVFSRPFPSDVPRPGPLSGHSFVVDPARNKGYLFGGLLLASRSETSESSEASAAEDQPSVSVSDGEDPFGWTATAPQVVEEDTGEGSGSCASETIAPQTSPSPQTPFFTLFHLESSPAANSPALLSDNDPLDFLDESLQTLHNPAHSSCTPSIYVSSEGTATCTPQPEPKSNDVTPPLDAVEYCLDAITSSLAAQNVFQDALRGFTRQSNAESGFEVYESASPASEAVNNVARSVSSLPISASTTLAGDLSSTFQNSSESLVRTMAVEDCLETISSSLALQNAFHWKETGNRGSCQLDPESLEEVPAAKAAEDCPHTISSSPFIQNAGQRKVLGYISGSADDQRSAAPQNDLELLENALVAEAVEDRRRAISSSLVVHNEFYYKTSEHVSAEQHSTCNPFQNAKHTLSVVGYPPEGAVGALNVSNRNLSIAEDEQEALSPILYSASPSTCSGDVATEGDDRLQSKLGECVGLRDVVVAAVSDGARFLNVLIERAGRRGVRSDDLCPSRSCASSDLVADFESVNWPSDNLCAGEGHIEDHFPSRSCEDGNLPDLDNNDQHVAFAPGTPRDHLPSTALSSGFPYSLLSPSLISPELAAAMHGGVEGPMGPGSLGEKFFEDLLGDEGFEQASGFDPSTWKAGGVGDGEQAAGQVGSTTGDQEVSDSHGFVLGYESETEESYGGSATWTADVWVFDFCDGTWELIRPKSKLCPRGRYTHASWLVEGPHGKGGVLHIFGGDAICGTYYNDLWSFDTYTRTWTQHAVSGDVPSARTGHTAAVCDGCVVVFGGEKPRSRASTTAMPVEYSDTVYRMPLRALPGTTLVQAAAQTIVLHYLTNPSPEFITAVQSLPANLLQLLLFLSPSTLRNALERESETCDNAETANVGSETGVT